MAYKGSIAKLIFLIFNCIFWLMGVIIFILGVYVKLRKEAYLYLLPSNEASVAVSLAIAAGIIVFTTGTIGFLGIWMKNQCMLLLYFVLVLVIFCLEIAAGIIAVIYWNRINGDSSADRLEWQNDFMTTLRDPSRREYWDYVQRDLSCCGVTEYRDWHNYASTQLYYAVPDSCCQVEYVGCGQAGGQLSWQEGCYTKLEEKVLAQDSIIMIAASGIALGVLQIALMITSLLYLKHLRSDHKLLE
ncbi:tetraspanin-9-like [Liolophura sinensis]|uniref:tetraspanin-9-like n=1 Tax=Liolophura sinensis TaxID=3198878 RepID=UPI0031588672